MTHAKLYIDNQPWRDGSLWCCPRCQRPQSPRIMKRSQVHIRKNWQDYPIAEQDKTRYSILTRQDKTRQNNKRTSKQKKPKTTQHNTSQDNIRQDNIRQDKERQDNARKHKTTQDKTTQDKDKIRQDKTRQHDTTQDNTRLFLFTATHVLEWSLARASRQAWGPRAGPWLKLPLKSIGTMPPTE